MTGQEDVPVWTGKVSWYGIEPRVTLTTDRGYAYVVADQSLVLTGAQAEALVAQLTRGASPAPVAAEGGDVRVEATFNKRRGDGWTFDVVNGEGVVCSVPAAAKVDLDAEQTAVRIARLLSAAPVAPVLPDGAPEGAVPSPWTEGAVICLARRLPDGWEMMPGPGIVEARPVPAPTVMAEVPVDVLEAFVTSSAVTADVLAAREAIAKARESREGRQ